MTTIEFARENAGLIGVLSLWAIFCLYMAVRAATSAFYRTRRQFTENRKEARDE